MAHVWMSHGTVRYVKRTLLPCALPHVPLCVVSNIWTSHGTRIYESDTRMNESWHIALGDMYSTTVSTAAYPSTSRGKHINESWHIYECVMAYCVRWQVLDYHYCIRISTPAYPCISNAMHIRISHGICMPESCLAYERVMAHVWMNHVIHVTPCASTHSHVTSYMWLHSQWQHSFTCHTCLTWFIHVRHVHVTLLHMYALIHMSDVNHTCQTCTRHTCEWVLSHGVTRSGICMPESCLAYEWVMAHVWMIHVIHVNECCHME